MSRKPRSPGGRPAWLTLNNVIEGLMTIMLVFTPFAFGTTQAWSREMFFFLVAAMIACVILRIVVDPTARVVWSWSYIPIILFLALVAAQMLPLEKKWVMQASPNTIKLKSDLLADNPNHATVLDQPTVSFYPYATREQLQILLAVAGVFFVVLHYYRDTARIKRLLMTIASVGLAVACLAAYQNIVAAKTIYGVVTAVHRDSGPFMNYSHFGQFMNMSIGAAAGLLLVELTEMSALRRASRVRLPQEKLDWKFWVLGAVCVLGPITVFLSMTRMGMISLLVSGGLTLALVGWKGRGKERVSLFACFGVIVLAALLAVGFDSIYARLATLRHIDISTGGRLQMLKDMTAEFHLFPNVGTGLGTHEFVFPMYDHSNIPLLATHAENEYAQLLEECGIAGVAIMSLFLLAMIVNYLKVILRPRIPMQYAAFGLGFGLLAILMHSATDFGQHIPANAILTATFAALLITLVRLPKIENRPRVSTSRWKTIGSRFVLVFLGGPVAAVMLGLCVWVLASADRATRAEYQWNVAEDVRTDLETVNWEGTNNDYIDLITPAQLASAMEPDNVTYKYWLNVYRWQSISRVNDDQTGAVMLTPDELGFTKQIASDLRDAQLLCPTYGPPLCVAGELEAFVLNQHAGENHIQTAFSLTPYDRTVCLIAGKLAVQQKQWNQAQVDFARASDLGGTDNDIVDDYLQANRPDLAYAIARGNGDALQYLADRPKVDPKLATRCRNEAISLLLVAVQQPDPPPQSFADLAKNYSVQGDKKAAINWYRKALDGSYGNVEWRLELTQLLADTGQTVQAAHEARICLHLRPQSEKAQALCSSLSVSADAMNSANTDGSNVVPPDLAARTAGAVQ